MRKSVFRVNTNSKGSDQPVEIYSLIRNFTILSYILQYHYENTLFQIYRKLYNQNKEYFQIKISDIFPISAHNIDCGYSLEPPRRGGSNEYHHLCFF